MKIAIFSQSCAIFHIHTCFHDHFTNILNLPFENDFYTSIPSVNQNDVPKSMVLMFVQNYLNEQDKLMHIVEFAYMAV